MKNHSDTTPVQSFESTVKDTKPSPINPKFNTEQLSTNGFKNHIEEILPANDAFPLEALPKQVKEIIRQTNEALNFPVAFIAAALLHAASTAIGNTHVSKWKWIENACIYLALVGNPGTIKSHPINWAYAPFFNKDRDYYKSYKERDKEFSVLNAAYQKSKKSEGLEPPQKPILRKYIISDCTPEAFVEIQQNNPRGTCTYNDELSGWMSRFSRYSNNSGEEQMHLSIWSGQPIVVDRKLSGPVRVERPFNNVIGTLQPSILDDMAKERKTENGFTHRFLFVKPEGLKRQGWNTKELDPTIKEEWFRIINTLLTLDFAKDENGDDKPVQVWYTKEAEKVLIEWKNDNVREDEEYSNETRDGLSAKLEIYVFRFSLILQLLKWACGKNEKQSIDADTVKEAIKIVKYFKQSALKVAEYMGNKNPVDRLPENKQNIYRSLPPIFTTDTGVSIGSVNGMPERTFKHWLKERDLFKNVKHGEYQKIYA